MERRHTERTGAENHPQDLAKIRRRIEDRLRKDQEAVLRVAELLKIKLD